MYLQKLVSTAVMALAHLLTVLFVDNFAPKNLSSFLSCTVLWPQAFALMVGLVVMPHQLLIKVNIVGFFVNIKLIISLS